VAARALVLHVGIHKTASTYIQHRLKGNLPFLRQQRLLYPRRRCDHLELVKALRTGDLKPWERLLRKAEREQCRALVSAEILSLVLCQRSRAGAGTVLAELLQLLNSMGVALELVAFVRDQPSYLNSRYTQLLKRFYLSIPFPRYVQQTLRAGGESKCDYLELFGEALDRPEVHCQFLPFRSGEADPCERLLQAVGLSDLAGLQPLEQQPNVQPGWQAIWIAQRIAGQLAEHHPQAWNSGACKIRIRDRLEALALEQGWPAEPFQGLNEALLNKIEQRYGDSNDRFAERVWGCGWRELFPRPTPPAMPMRPRSREERTALLALVDDLVAMGVQETSAADQLCVSSAKGMR
jgi:hypothetical protein